MCKQPLTALPSNFRIVLPSLRPLLDAFPCQLPSPSRQPTLTFLTTSTVHLFSPLGNSVPTTASPFYINIRFRSLKNLKLLFKATGTLTMDSGTSKSKKPFHHKALAIITKDKTKTELIQYLHGRHVFDDLHSSYLISLGQLYNDD